MRGLSYFILPKLIKTNKKGQNYFKNFDNTFKASRNVFV